LVPNTTSQQHPPLLPFAPHTDDFEAVKLIAQEVGNDAQPDGYVPVICAMARTVTKDLDR
jgi:hypothetical protein